MCIPFVFTSLAETDGKRGIKMELVLSRYEQPPPLQVHRARSRFYSCLKCYLA